MSRVDCHILMDPARSELSETILAQLAEEPVHVWRVPARPGAITAARIDAFSLGNAPYVCWVDDDDTITPGIFQALVDALDRNPQACGVFCSEAHVTENGDTLLVKPAEGQAWDVATMINDHPFVHHIALIRRALLPFHLQTIRAFPRVGDQLLLWLMANHGPWIHVPVIGYHWRRWPTQITADTRILDEIESAKAFARERFGLPPVEPVKPPEAQTVAEAPPAQG